MLERVGKCKCTTGTRSWFRYRLADFSSRGESGEVDHASRCHSGRVATADGPAPELHERLAALSTRLETRARELDARKDSRAVFTHAYALLTTRIENELPTDPSFDPNWTVSLAEAFAARYFTALDAYDRREEVPPAWDAVFHAIGDRRTSVIETSSSR